MPRAYRDRSSRDNDRVPSGRGDDARADAISTWLAERSGREDIEGMMSSRRAPPGAGAGACLRDP
jgi:hypothetical protein